MRIRQLVPLFIFGGLLFWFWLGTKAGNTQEYIESPYVYVVEAERCLHGPETEESLIRKQTGFRVKGTAGILTALHGIADCESMMAISEAENGEAFGRLELVAADVDRDVALLLPDNLDATEERAFALEGLDLFTDTTEISYDGLYVIGHPYGARAQYMTEQIQLR
ncbi:MAG TPA: serine protease, partial [Caldilineaceae bacterium]|nr:serine protease [Caldilineaceae bacterium]